MLFVGFCDNGRLVIFTELPKHDAYFVVCEVRRSEEFYGLVAIPFFPTVYDTASQSISDVFQRGDSFCFRKT